MDAPNPSDLLTISTTANGIEVGGEIDASTAWIFARQIDDHSYGDVVLNMEAVRFIDSSGLRVLVETHQRLERLGHRLVIETPSAVVRRVLSVSGLTGYLHVASGTLDG